MKKQKSLGLTAVTSAFCLTAFTFRTPLPTASYYWFPLDPTSGFPQSVSSLVYRDTDPADCGNFPSDPFCSAAYTSFNGTGPYTAAGSVVKIDYSREEHPKK